MRRVPCVSLQVATSGGEAMKARRGSEPFDSRRARLTDPLDPTGNDGYGALKLGLLNGPSKRHHNSVDLF